MNTKPILSKLYVDEHYEGEILNLSLDKIIDPDLNQDLFQVRP